MQTSRAAIFDGPREPLRLDVLPIAPLTPQSALVRVRCATLCGSDLHTLTGKRSAPAPGILGHEIVGEVVALPEEPLQDHAGQPLQIGQRVTWALAAACGDCFFCQHDLPQKCEILFKYGHEPISHAPALSGGLAEYCQLVPGTAVFEVPSVLPDEIACPAACATATVAGALRVAGLTAGEVLLVQGAGMLGLTTCAMAAWLGARQIVLFDPDPERAQLATQFGATRAFSARDDASELERTVAELTSGRGADAVLEMSGAVEAMVRGVNALRMGGRYVWVGAVYPTPPVPVAAETIVRRCLTIRGLHNYHPSDLHRALEFLAAAYDHLPLTALVPRSFKLADASAAVDFAIRERPHRVAIVP